MVEDLLGADLVPGLGEVQALGHLVPGLVANQGGLFDVGQGSGEELMVSAGLDGGFQLLVQLVEELLVVVEGEVFFLETDDQALDQFGGVLNILGDPQMHHPSDDVGKV